MQGDDIGARVELTFEEAAFGAEKEVTGSRVEDCDQCHGSGAAPGTSAETCPRCRGTGSVRTQQNFMGMTMQSTAACPDCRGTGRIIRTPCSRCKGKGKVRRSHKLMVKFPAGIDDGQTLRVRGEGNTGLYGGLERRPDGHGQRPQPPAVHAAGAGRRLRDAHHVHAGSLRSGGRGAERSTARFAIRSARARRPARRSAWRARASLMSTGAAAATNMSPSSWRRRPA